MYHRALPWRWLLSHSYEEGALFPGFAIAALAVYAVARCGAGLHGQRETRSQRLLIASGILTLIVLARVWTGPFGWHIGPLPLPPFFPYQLFTIAFVLCIFGLALTVTARHSWARRDPVMFYAVAAALMWLLALGPEPAWSAPWRALWVGPYRWLMELPGVDSVRVPARAWMVAVLCLAMLAAFGMRAVVERFPRPRHTLGFLLAALIVAEGLFVDRTVEVPRVTIERGIPRGALALDLPMEEGYWNALPQYRGVLLGYRTINGFSGYEPPHFGPLRHQIAELNPTALDPYRRVEDLYVIVRPGEQPLVAEWVSNLPGAQLMFAQGGNRLYKLPQRSS
jgi:hypothetical protein